ncbi:MAG: glutaminase A [Verrucomicrobiales bacterium]|nr:glutaminase A [Verrucomicrobiales bacterium]
MPTSAPAPNGAHPATSAHSHSPIGRYLRALHDKYARLEEGTVATYIPELGRARPGWFGIAIATTDGQVYEVGDSRCPFTIQSISKPLVYGLALEAHGLKTVLHKCGVEPSGEAFNSISLEPTTGRPLNPMINAGAIAVSSLVPGATAAERELRLLRHLGDFAGRDLVLDQDVYRSERDTGHRNRAIAHLLRNAGILTGNPEDALDLYFRQCSIEVTCRDLAVMAACLATGGVNPVTRQRVLAPISVGRVLSVMTSCGMYDFSGEWIHTVGMPAKSGVAGGILAVLPGQLGVAVFSPPLDARGNSVRGIRVCTDLSIDFGLHLFNTPRVVSPALRARHTAATRRSRRRRVASELATLAHHGNRVRLYELRGRLIFATLELAMRAILEEAAAATHLILDLERVIDLDRAACRLLLDLRETLLAQGKQVMLTGLAQHTVLRDYVVARLTEDGWKDLCRHGARDDALELCEADLLRASTLPAPQDAVSALQRQELCAGLDEPSLRTLASLLQPQSHPAGSVVVHAGAPADSMVFLVDGEVEVVIHDDGGHSHIVGRLGPGMTFGEMALADRMPRSAAIRTHTDARFLVLKFEDFDQLPGRGQAALHARLIQNLAAVLARRLRDANAEVLSLR